MSYPITPTQLQEMWQNLQDRVTRLELGYSGPQASADSAYSLATTAYSLATTANTNSLAAGTLANAAQTTANGKNTAHYSTSTPSGGGTTGDIWWQFSGGNIIGQWQYNGSSWVTAPVANTVIANLDAGKITSGIISGIEFNNGSGTFHVYASGVLVATSATVTGSITASSGSIGNFNINSGDYLTYGSTAIYGGSSANSVYAFVDTTKGAYVYKVTTNGGGITCTNTGESSTFYNATIQNFLYNTAGATTTSAANMYINPLGGLIARVTSSQRYKVEILPETIPLDSIMKLQPKSWIDKVQYEANGNSSNGLKRIIGLIAEDLAELPVIKDLLVNYNDENQPDSVNYDRIAIALIPLLQNLHNRVTQLEGK